MTKVPFIKEVSYTIILRNRKVTELRIVDRWEGFVKYATSDNKTWLIAVEKKVSPVEGLLNFLELDVEKVEDTLELSKIVRASADIIQVLLEEFPEIYKERVKEEGLDETV